MGLDMYLNKKIYIGANYEHRGITGKIDIKEGKVKIPVNLSKVTYIIEQAGYWRKANAIHQWLVNNIQDGEDDCTEYYFSEEKMQELLDICNTILVGTILEDGKIANGYSYSNGEKNYNWEDGKVIKNPELAHKLLPCQEGFFFGSTHYDQYYYQDIQDTKEILEEALKSPGEYYYEASW